MDCYSRNGLLNEAKELIFEYEQFIEWNNNPNINISAYRAMWMSLLSGCRTHRNTNIGNNVYNEMQSRFYENEEYMTSAAALLANIHLLASGVNHDNKDNKITTKWIENVINDDL